MVLVCFFYGTAVAKDMMPLEIKIAKVLPSGSIIVTVNNPSKLPIKIWKDSNSWGAAHWRILVLRNGQLEVLFQNPNQRFTMNVPRFDEVAGKAHIEQKFDLNGGNWCWRGHCTSYDESRTDGERFGFEPNDTILILYDVPRTIEAVNMGVWYGVAAAHQ